MKQICYKLRLRAGPALNAHLNPESNSVRLAKLLPGLKQKGTILGTWPGPIPGQVLHLAYSWCLLDVTTLAHSGSRQHWISSRPQWWLGQPSLFLTGPEEAVVDAQWVFGPDISHLEFKCLFCFVLVLSRFYIRVDDLAFIPTFEVE